MASDLTGALEAASVTIMVIATVCVATRLWIRTHLKTLGVDDYLIAASWCFLIALCVIVILSSKVGFGRHRSEVSTEDYESFLRFTTGCSATYSVGVPLAKMSFAVLYIRINPQRALVLLNKFIIAFLACQAIEEVCVVVFKCTPIEASFKVGVKGTCLDLHVLWWSTFVFNLCTDLALFIQPIPSIWKLQLPPAKRVGIIFMLSLGLLVCVTSIIRIVFVTQIGLDDTYAFAEPMIWSEVELSALIVCSCIPCLRQVVQKIPWLNRAFGLSSDKASQPIYDRSGPKRPGGIPLYDYRGNDYLPRRSKGHEFGMTSQAVGGQHTKNDSTEDIFPHGTDNNGAIIVTHELTRDIESHITSTASSTAGSVKQVVHSAQDKT